MAQRQNPSPSGWSARPGNRHGAKRLPERVRRKVLARHPRCWLAYPGCTGDSTEVHHVIAASEFLPTDPRIDAEYIDGRPQLVGVCHRCHVTETSRQLNSWKRRPERHPGILP